VTKYSLPGFNFRTASQSKSLTTPPDVFQGYGSLRLSNILPLKTGQGLHPSLQLIVWDSLLLHPYSTLQWDVVIDNPANRYTTYHPPALKVTITWYDPPSAVATAKSLLLHDIDLLVVAPTGDILWGNNIAGGDEHNVVEQVVIRTPDCAESRCIYKVFVHANTLPVSGSQRVAVVVTTTGNSHYLSLSRDILQLRLITASYFLPKVVP